MLYRLTKNLFQVRFCVEDLAPHTRVVKIGEVRMGHGVTSDLKPQSAQFAELLFVHASWLAQKSYGDVKRSFESRLFQNGRRDDEIGLTAVVESYGNTVLFRSIGRPECQRLGDTQPAPFLLLKPVDVRAKIVLRQDVARVARLPAAKRATWNLQFVIHQEYDAWLRHRRLFTVLVIRLEQLSI